MFDPGQWLWSIEHRQPCKAVEASCLWDDATCHVRLPASESVVRATPDRLKPLDAAEASRPPRIRYVLYAGRIANLLSEERAVDGLADRTALRRAIECHPGAQAPGQAPPQIWK